MHKGQTFKGVCEMRDQIQLVFELAERGWRSLISRASAPPLFRPETPPPALGRPIRLFDSIDVVLVDD